MRLLGMAGSACLAGAAIAAAGGSAADTPACPVRDDLQTGVVLTRAAPLFESVFQSTADGLSEDTTRERDGVLNENTSIYDHPLLVAGRTDARSDLALVYAADTGAVAQLDALGQWTSDLTILNNGVPLGEGSVVLTYNGETTEQVGDCTYTAWDVRETITFAGGAPSYFNKFYAPDLGLVLRVVVAAPDWAPLTEVRFDRIEPVDP